MEKITQSRFSGERVKEERLRLGLRSQAAAAKKFGVERETWSRYETGKIEMGKEIFARFVKAGADADYIVTGHHSRVFEAMAAQAMLAHMKPGVEGEEAALLRHWHALPPHLRVRVNDLAEVLANLHKQQGAKR